MLTYPEAIDTLNALIERSRTYPVERTTARINAIWRTQRLLTPLENPQNTFPIIHITGTKGKGSVAAMMSAVLQTAGYCVGLYTSPHLQDFRERFQVNAQLADANTLAMLISQMQPLMADIPYLRWFEAVTALALAYFRHEKVDVAIVEVGVGGLYDATNVVHPILSIITSLSYDHTAVLGETLTEIATEKAGIIKPQTPIVSAPQPPEALTVIEHIAQQCAAPLHRIGHDSQYSPAQAQPSGQSVNIERNGLNHLYKTALVGEHQAINTAVVIASIEQLRLLGWHIREADVHEGLKTVRWPARFEIIEGSPLVVIDAAHNQASAGWLAKTLDTLFHDQDLTVVFGAMSDKDVAGMLAEFAGQAQHFIFTQAQSGRALAPDRLKETALSIGITNTQISLAPTIKAALALANNMATQIICITGSLYVVGEARDVLGLQSTPLMAISGVGGQQAE